MRYSLKQIKVIIVLMSINTFALFVNYFGYGIRLTEERSSFQDGNDFYLLTNSQGFPKYIRYSDQTYFDDNSEFFYPLVPFYNKDYRPYYYKEELRGVFAYYDFTEFFVYTILIFAIPFIYNYIKKRELEELKDKKKHQRLVGVFYIKILLLTHYFFVFWGLILVTTEM